MEYLVVVAIIIVGAILYMGGRFANFKSRLMNELGKRGMDYESADALYTVMANDINKLHHDGVSVSAIADIIVQIGSSDTSEDVQTTNFGGFDDWLEVFKQECDKTKAGVSPFLDFMDLSNLQKAYEAGKDPKEIAYHFAKDFDPLKIK